ncbi:MAG: cell division protein ZapA [Bacteroidota bacterium]|nr:cell division protein ZapA [Bacteroidota bacterium]
MAEMIPVNIVIGDRTYRLKIEPEDEEVLRKTVKIINDKIVEFKNSFAGKDMQDYIAMVLLWYATEQAKKGPGILEQKETSDKILAIQSLIDKALVKNQ